MSVKQAEDYVLKNGPLRLTVVVGQGQNGRSIVMLDEDEIGRDDSIDMAVETPIGGTGLGGRTLRILTVVSGTNPNTNLTSVSYSLSGGAKDRAFTLDFELEDAGDSIDYEVSFALSGAGK